MTEILLTRSDVAKRYGVCNETVKRWAKKGLIKPVITINKRDRFKLEDLERSLAGKNN